MLLMTWRPGWQAPTILYDFFFFFQAEDGIRDVAVTGVQTCALPISLYEFRLKCTCTCNSTETGWPFKVVGSYFHCNTAFNAASMSSGCPLTTRAWTTFPCSSITASTTTVPQMCASRASGGYAGSTEYVRRGAFRFEPTRTIFCTGLGCGGGVRTAVPVPPKKPPTTPPICPPTTPPGTPPRTPPNSGAASAAPSEPEETLFGIAAGAVSFCNV